MSRDGQNLPMNEEGEEEEKSDFLQSPSIFFLGRYNQLVIELLSGTTFIFPYHLFWPKNKTFQK